MHYGFRRCLRFPGLVAFSQSSAFVFKASGVPGLLQSCYARDSLLGVFGPPSSESWFLEVKADGALVSRPPEPPSCRKDAGSLAEEHPRLTPIRQTAHPRSPRHCLPLAALILIDGHRLLQEALSGFPRARSCCLLAFPLSVGRIC